MLYRTLHRMLHRMFYRMSPKAEIERLKAEHSAREKELRGQVQGLGAELLTAREDIDGRDAAIERQQRELEAKASKCSELADEVERLRALLASSEATVGQQRRELDSKTSQCAELESEVESKDAAIEQQQREIRAKASPPPWLGRALGRRGLALLLGVCGMHGHGHTHACMLAHNHVLTRACKHARTHARTLSLTGARAGSSCTHTHMHALTQMYMHTSTHASTHACMHARACQRGTYTQTTQAVTISAITI